MTQYLTYKQLAEMLSVDRGTIRRWVNAGTFPQPSKLGRTVLFNAREVEEHLEAHKIREENHSAPDNT